MRDLPMSMLELLAEFYGVIEDGEPWPQSLAEGVLALVPKKATAVVKHVALSAKIARGSMYRKRPATSLLYNIFHTALSVL